MTSINGAPFWVTIYGCHYNFIERDLFHRNRFGQVTGLIYITTSHYRNMIG